MILSWPRLPAVDRQDHPQLHTPCNSPEGNVQRGHRSDDRDQGGARGRKNEDTSAWILDQVFGFVEEES